MNATNPRSKTRQGRLFLLSLRVAWGRLSLWGGVALTMALLSLVVAFPWHQWFQSLDGHRLQAGEQFRAAPQHPGFRRRVGFPGLDDRDFRRRRLVAGHLGTLP